MRLAYSMEPVPREEMAASDPFDGAGIFLPAPGMTSGQMLERLAATAGTVIPAVAWDGIGVWAAPGSSDVSIPDLESVWKNPDG